MPESLNDNEKLFIKNELMNYNKGKYINHASGNRISEDKKTIPFCLVNILLQFNTIKYDLTNYRCPVEVADKIFEYRSKYSFYNGEENLKRDNIGRSIRDWFSPAAKYLPKRPNLILLAFIFEFTLEQCNQFLQYCGELPLNPRKFEDAIYIFCLIRKKSYAEAFEIFEENVKYIREIEAEIRIADKSKYKFKYHNNEENGRLKVSEEHLRDMENLLNCVSIEGSNCGYTTAMMRDCLQTATDFSDFCKKFKDKFGDFNNSAREFIRAFQNDWNQENANHVPKSLSSYFEKVYTNLLSSKKCSEAISRYFNALLPVNRNVFILFMILNSKVKKDNLNGLLERCGFTKMSEFYPFDKLIQIILDLREKSGKENSKFSIEEIIKHIYEEYELFGEDIARHMFLSKEYKYSLKLSRVEAHE